MTALLLLPQHSTGTVLGCDYGEVWECTNNSCRCSPVTAVRATPPSFENRLRGYRIRASGVIRSEPMDKRQLEIQLNSRVY
ncbi:hypothetical protein AB6A40_006748 [Gnathostoma spinigerum]|uniref:Uncharacterized protein n=1 Tax=Gnathostoma spinigerum TaxID=75299 RepID=A0ABD6EJ92_9BILA